MRNLEGKAKKVEKYSLVIFIIHRHIFMEWIYWEQDDAKEELVKSSWKRKDTERDRERDVIGISFN